VPHSPEAHEWHRIIHVSVRECLETWQLQSKNGPVTVEALEAILSRSMVPIRRQVEDKQPELVKWRQAMSLFSGSTPVIVAVVDTGVALDHPDITSNLWRNTGETFGNGLDDDHNGYIDDRVGWDFVDRTPASFDQNGHGTLVASLIAGVQNNGIGVAGMSPTARHHSATGRQ
jgi:subtilisin family serine protease